MRPLLGITLLWILAFSPPAINAQSSVSSVNVGPHGNDWFIGTWTCKSIVQSALTAGPLSKTIASRSASSPSDIFYRTTGQGSDDSGYLHYDAKTQTWWNPFAFSNGTAVNESTRQTGKTTVWNGTVSDASGTRGIRDTYVQMNMRVFTDLTQVQTGGTWKIVGRSTCTKS